MPEPAAAMRRRGRPASVAAEPIAEVQSLDRAIGLLELVAGSDGLTLSEVARQADLPLSTVHRLLTTLLRRRLVQHDSESGIWNVGVGSFRIGSAYLRLRKLPDIARPLIRRLLAEVDETVNVSMLDRREIVCVAQAESHSAVRAFFRLGRRLPVHASAAGKAILACGSDAFREEMLAEGSFERFTERTHTCREALLADVAKVKQRGWAIDDEEYAAGMRCVSSAILSENHEPAGAVSISAPSGRMSSQRLERFGERVRTAAAELTDLYCGIAI